MNQPLDISSINLVARLLGAFFYYSPDSETLIALRSALNDIESLFSWHDPQFIVNQRNIMLDSLTDGELPYQYSVLFEGQGTMPAPPWGSVYLDKENLLMGESTERYRVFLADHNIVIQTGLNEPEDQFGLMLMALALLIESEQFDAAKILLSEHLLTWAPRYLALLSQNDISPFYRALAASAESYLNQLVAQLQLHMPFYYLYK
ncbi:molecular chaperone TorD family protein [Orbus sturtevantii]|uniref:molecular chaperone TorD family protein n=1 Tax=Orbus sturtevantii TaxID=3074109 RepID=UPI00370D2454